MTFHSPFSHIFRSSLGDSRLRVTLSNDDTQISSRTYDFDRDILEAWVQFWSILCRVIAVERVVSHQLRLITKRDKPEFDLALVGPRLWNRVRDFSGSFGSQVDIVQDTFNRDNVLFNLTDRSNKPVLNTT